MSGILFPGRTEELYLEKMRWGADIRFKKYFTYLNNTLKQIPLPNMPANHCNTSQILKKDEMQEKALMRAF